MDINILKENMEKCLEELFSACGIEGKKLLVVGCSSSEILGYNIGKFTSAEIGEVLFDILFSFTKKNNIDLAIQCCEHLNRSLVVEKATLISRNLKEVNVIPQLSAGGSLAVAAYNNFTEPVVVMNVEADAGIDIGDTIIGMHMKNVAVPVRPSIKDRKIGEANVVMCYSRLPYIGGPRAIYKK